MDLTADASAKLGGSGVSVVSGGSASVESQGSLALSVDESSSGGVDVVAPSVSAKTENLSLAGTQAVSVESVGDMKMSSSQSSILADQTMVLSVGAAEASESGVISLEAGNQLDASAGSTNIVATNKEGIKLTTSGSPDSMSGSLSLSSGRDVDLTADASAKLG